MLESQVYRGSASLVPQQPQPQPPEETLIEVEESTGEFARIVAAPLPPGFGTTVGNALRRVLLSSLNGAAVTSVRIDGVQHEFSTIPNVKEDTIEFLLNVKEMRIRAHSDRPGTMVLDISEREGPITAADIQVPEHYEIVNPDLYLLTVDSPSGRLYIEFNVEQGRGYVPAGQVDGTTIGVIPVDAIFSPVRKVTYKVESTRVGQATNYDKLTVEVQEVDPQGKISLRPVGEGWDPPEGGWPRVEGEDRGERPFRERREGGDLRGLAIEDALYCGVCSPQPQPVGLDFLKGETEPS